MLNINRAGQTGHTIELFDKIISSTQVKISINWALGQDANRLGNKILNKNLISELFPIKFY